jgi:hypothetical protein
MKTLLTLILLMTFSVVGFSQDIQDSTQVTNKRQRPKATYKVGSAQVTVWLNKKSDGTTWKNFKVENFYKKDDKWLSTNSFSETDLLELKAAIDKAISEETVKKK